MIGIHATALMCSFIYLSESICMHISVFLHVLLHLAVGFESKTNHSLLDLWQHLCIETKETVKSDQWSENGELLIMRRCYKSYWEDEFSIWKYSTTFLFKWQHFQDGCFFGEEMSGRWGVKTETRDKRNKWQAARVPGREPKRFYPWALSSSALKHSRTYIYTHMERVLV